MPWARTCICRWETEVVSPSGMEAEVNAVGLMTDSMGSTATATWGTHTHAISTTVGYTSLWFIFILFFFTFKNLDVETYFHCSQYVTNFASWHYKKVMIHMQLNLSTLFVICKFEWNQILILECSSCPAREMQVTEYRLAFLLVIPDVK